MATTKKMTLFYNSNRKYTIGDGLNIVTFDLLLSENHTRSNVITTHPVENGVNISDHIQNNLFQGGLNGLVTNFSIKKGEITSNRAQEAFDLFERIWKARQLVTIITGLKLYKNVAITNMSTGRNQGDGESVNFSVTFREFNKVELKSVAIEATVNITEFEEPADQQAAPTVDVGRTVPEETYTVEQLAGVPDSVIVSVASGGVV
jgi:hypothetical protein